MVEKIKGIFNIKNVIKKIGDFFTGLFNVVSYNEQTKKVNDSLEKVTQQMGNIAEGLKSNTSATNTLSNKISGLEKEITKIKDGLQIELFGSLQALYARLKDQKFATPDQKREAELFYTQIHNLGKDGWSEYYYTEIIKMPESREDYWQSVNEHH